MKKRRKKNNHKINCNCDFCSGRKRGKKPPKIVEKEKLVNLYCEQKKSSGELAKIFNVSKRTALNWLKFYNIPRRKPSESLKIFYKNNKAYFYGKKHKEETKLKLSLAKINKYVKSKNPNWKGGKFIKCKNCGKEIWRTPYQLKKWKIFYCSKECRKEYYKKKKPKCKYCGKIINKKANKKFCDFECYRNYKLNDVYELNCKCCDKKIRIIKWRYEKSKYKLFFCSNKCKGKYFSKEKNPNYGNHQIKLEVRKGKYVKCYNCDNLIYTKPCEVKEIEKGKKVFCCWDCKVEYERGENASNWKGGLSFIIYPREFNYYLKNKIRKRDKYICQKCGIKQDKLNKKLDIHHIDYIKSNISSDNLVSLCRSCHGKTFFNREYWKEYFTKWKSKLLKIKQ